MNKNKIVHKLAKLNSTSQGAGGLTMARRAFAQIYHVHLFMAQEALLTVIYAIVTSRLDYYSTHYMGCP